MAWEKEKEEKKECNCCIEIEDSLVVIVCDELEIDKLKDTLKTFVELKGSTNLANKEQE